jgi:BMFP domain-containing protein YqiC
LRASPKFARGCLFFRASDPISDLIKSNFCAAQEWPSGAHRFKAEAHQRGARLRQSKGKDMDMNNFFNDLQSKINQAIENSPAKDIEKNVKAMMTQGFSKLDLVTREEFDIQAQVLAKTRAKLEALEIKMTELELKVAELAAAK